MQLTSPVFEQGETIPEKYSCDGSDLIPPLEFSDIPENTESLVLLVYDPTAPNGTWYHFIKWNIDPTLSKINEGEVPSSGIIGKNSWRKQEFNGPCPPEGDKPHEYHFNLYALNTKLDADEQSSVKYIESLMDQNTIEIATLKGKYQR